MAGVRLAAGGTALLWVDSSSTNSHALGWVLDAAGNPLGEAVDLSPGSPRTEFVTLAAAPRGGAFGAFTRCADYSICGKSVVQLATFAADGAVRAATVTADDGRYWGPALAVLPAGGADAPPRLALAMGRGEYSARRVVVRFADLPDAGDPGPTLRTAEDVALPANRGDDVGAVAAAAGPAGLVVAFVDDGPGDSTILRTFLARPDAAPVEGVTLEEADPPAWGAHRLVGYPGGVALVGSRPAGHETDTVLLLLEPDASAVRRTIVVGRGLSARNPALAFADGRFGLAWYDGATDGIWAALVDDSGRKALGASRLDDPAARASFGYAVVVPPAADRPWNVWYTDPYRLERAELPVPATP
jgi:hypothetical protein